MEYKRYIGIPFLDRGRSFEGLDCWGLVRLFYLEELGIELPSYADEYQGTTEYAKLSELVHRGKNDGNWNAVSTGDEQPGDVILLRVAGSETHIGVVLGNGMMLHAERKTGVIAETYRGLLWRSRVSGFTRFCPRHEAETGLLATRGVEAGETGARVEVGLPEPSSAVPIRYFPSPFRYDPTITAVPEGKTIRELLGAFCPRASELGAVVLLEDLRISPERWDEVLPRAGQVLTVRVVPMGAGEPGSGTKNPLRTILMLTVVATAAWGGGAIAGAMGAKGWLFYALSAAFASGIGMAGYAAVNALVPIPVPKLESSTVDAAVYSITGVQNVANLYGAIPRVFGRHRMWPPLAARPYTEAVGQETYFRMLFCGGWGPINIPNDSFKIGETDARNYDIEIEALRGDEGVPRLRLFPQNIHEEPYSIRLSSASTELTTQPDTDEAVVEVSFPGGLVNLTGGLKNEASVTLYAQYREHGSSDPWVPSVDDEDLSAELNLWTLEGDATYNAGTGEITLGGSGGQGSATSPLMEVLYAASVNFRAQFYSASGSPMADFYNTFWGKYGYGGGATSRNNDDGTPAQGYSYPYATGSWVSVGENVVCGAAIFWVKVKISTLIYPFATIKFRAPHMGRSHHVTVRASTTSLVRRSIRWLFPDRGQYDIRVSRSVETGNANIIEAAYLSMIQSITHERPVRKDGLCLVAVRVKASGVLSGVLDNFNFVAEAELPTWNGSAWEPPSFTNNPAWCMLEVYRGAMNARPIADDRIDMERFLEFYLYCLIGGFTFNGVLDKFMSKRDILAAIAAVARAEPAFRDSKHSVIWDDLKDTSALPLFTDRNSSDLTIQKAFVRIPHALKVKFLNEDAGYAEDQRIVYDDGYSVENATEFESVEMWGVTDPDLIFRLARYRLGEIHLRNAVYTRRVDAEQLSVTKGDLANVQSDVSLWGIVAARVTSFTKASSVGHIFIDTEVTMEAGKSYGIVVRYATGAPLSAVITTVPGTGKELLVTPWAGGLPDVPVGALLVFGESASVVTTCIVRDIQQDSDLAATISFVRYDPALYTCDTEEIPDFDSGITIPAEDRRAPAVPQIVQARSDETVLYRDSSGSLRARILVDFRIPTGGEIEATHVQARYRASSSGESWQTLPTLEASATEISITGVEEGSSYDIELRSVSRFGRTSGWIAILGHTVVGKGSLPPDVEILYLEPPAVLVWAYPDVPLDFAGFLLRVAGGNDPTWSHGRPLTDTPITATRFNVGTITGGLKTFMLKAVDVAGNESASPAVLIRDTGDPDAVNPLYSEDQVANGFAGYTEGGSVSGGDLVADSASLFWPPDDELFWLADSELFWGDDYAEMTYEYAFKPPTEYLPASVLVASTIEALREFLYRVTSPEFEDEFSGSMTDMWGTPTAGTWTIVSGVLEVVHDSGGAWNQTMTQIGNFSAFGGRQYISVRVKAETAANSRLGIGFGGQYFIWDRTQYYATFVPTSLGGSPAMVDDTWYWWLFEILPDGTVNWYIDGVLLGSETLHGSTGNVVILVAQPYNGSPSKKYYFDEVRVWSPTAEFRSWPGALEITQAADLVDFRIKTAGGGEQGIISELETTLDAPTIREVFSDVSISSSGTRLSLTKTYRTIKTVLVTLQDDGGSARTWRVMDKSASLGPLLKVFDSSFVACSGTIDAEIEGY